MNAKDRKHLGRVAALGCQVCNNLGFPDSPCEIHHLRSGMGMGQRSKHDRAIGLCHAHHRTGGYGVAIHAGQKEFERKYGTELELLDQVNQLLGACYE